MKDLAAGKFLVAARELPDPNFADSVVLLVEYGEEGAMGLIINRRTRLPISRILKELKQAKERADPVYLGGPVAMAGALALVRSRAKPEEARHVVGDVYMLTTKTTLEKTLASGAEQDAVRVYLGHSGWSPGQLQREVELGTWHIFRADPGIVFDPDPDTVWSRLIRRTEQQLAANAPPRRTLLD